MDMMKASVCTVAKRAIGGINGKNLKELSHALYDGVTDAEKFAYSIHVGLLLGLLYPKVKQKDGWSRFRPYGISILYRMIVY